MNNFPSLIGNLNVVRSFCVHDQVHCLVEHGALLDRPDSSGTRGSGRTTGCQNPALVASLLKKASRTGISTTLSTTVL